MGHGVVQLARQLDPLLGLRLLEPAAPVVVLRARRDAQRHRGDQHGRPADQVRDPGPAHEEGGRGRDQDDREPGQHLTPRSPPEQRVRQEQEVDRRGHVERWLVRDDQPDVHPDRRAEGHRHHRERMRTPPQKGWRQPHRHEQRQPRKPKVLAQRDLQQGAHRDHAHEQPVPPHPRRRRRGARLVQHGPQRVDHRPSLGKPQHAGTGRKSDPPPAERHDRIPASTPMCRHPGDTNVEALAGVPHAGRSPRSHRVRSTRTTGPLRRPSPLGRDRHLGSGLPRGPDLRGFIRSGARGPLRGTRARLATRHRAADEGRRRRHGPRRRRRPHAARPVGEPLRLASSAGRCGEGPGSRRGAAPRARHERPGRRARRGPAVCNRVRGRLTRRRGRAGPHSVPRARRPVAQRPGRPQGHPRRPPRHDVPADRGRWGPLLRVRDTAGRARRGPGPGGRNRDPAAGLRINRRHGSADRDGPGRPRGRRRVVVRGGVRRRRPQLGGRDRIHGRAGRRHRLRAVHPDPFPRAPRRGS